MGNSATVCRLVLQAEAHVDALRRTFRISRKSETIATYVQVSLHDGGITALGEASPVDFKGQTTASMIADIEAARHQIEARPTRAELQSLMPATAARHAVDAALWDLEAKRTGRSSWEIAGIDRPPTITTHYTIGLDTIEAMVEHACQRAAFTRLKIKLNDTRPVETIEAIHAARPDARLIVDANEGWTLELLNSIAPALDRLSVELIEQPLPAAHDGLLDDYTGPVPLCADESCLTSASLAPLQRKYRYINIKLDKTGGLTEGLELARQAKARGLGLMVGCNYGTTLGMAPALLIAAQCEFVDLDAPLLQVSDRSPTIRYDGGVITLAHEVWG